MGAGTACGTRGHLLVVHRARPSGRSRRIGVFRFALRWSAVVALALAAALAHASDEAQAAKARAERESAAVLQSVRELVKGGSLGSIEATAIAVEGKWRVEHPHLASGTILDICGELSSRKFEERNRAFGISQRLVTRLLGREKDLPLELHVRAAVMLQRMLADDGRALSPEDAAVKRLSFFETWTGAWKRVMEAFEPEWKKSDRLVAPDPPPGYARGVRPESLPPGPEREAYARTWDEFSKVLSRDRLQRTVRSLCRTHIPALTDLMVNAYREATPSERPKMAEVLQAVTALSGGKELRERVLGDPPREAGGHGTAER